MCILAHFVRLKQQGLLPVRSRGEGDSTFSVFVAPLDALKSAAAFQRALHAEPWPEEAPIRVRAARLYGMARSLKARYGVLAPAPRHEQIEEAMKPIAAELGKDAYAAIVAEGFALTTDEVLSALELLLADDRLFERQ